MTHFNSNLNTLGGNKENVHNTKKKHGKQRCTCHSAPGPRFNAHTLPNPPNGDGITRYSSPQRGEETHDDIC